MKHEAVWILDFGSQYTQLIARRVRECGVYCEIKPCTEKAPETIPPSVVGIVLSGGPASVLAEDAPEFDVGWLRTSIPILGICYGMQLLARLGGGDVRSGRSREYGPVQVLLSHGKSALFEGLTGTSPQMVWMSHGDHVAQVPNGFEAIAHSENGILAAMSCESQQRYGLQFHPEVTHTVQGKEVLENFVLKICGAKGDWTTGAFIDEQVALIRDTVGKNNVICGLSGGVDSSVVAALLHRAIPDQLYCIFVDNGLCRENESMDLKEDFVGYNIKIVDAQKTFLSALEGVSDPEAKRKIIGETFIRVFEKEASAVPNALYLAQGTLYPDVIESVSVQGPSATIKSHHNVGGLPEDMTFKLIEPLRELFKDEARSVGTLLGLPEERVWRHPFPGPGLAVRCLGDLVESRLASLRRADAIFIEEIKRAGLYRTIWQAFAVLLPVKSVGVMGDERTYEEVCVLRAVTSHDGMTADWVEMPYEVLGITSSRIINEIKGINRVAYDISSKPPATIEWE